MTIPLDPAHLVGVGGAIGAVLRHAVSRRLAVEAFPVGTLAVNAIGSFVLGLVTFLGASTDVLLLVGTGICGSFTTFSTFSFETVRLWETGERFRSGLNAVSNLAFSLLGLGLAWAIAGLV